jgi:hypothetical protein
MHARRNITDRQYAAGVQLYTAYVLGIVGAREEELPVRCRALMPSGYSLARLEAATGYRQAVAAIGRHLANIIRLVVVGEVTVEKLAAAINQGREQVMSALKVGLDMLADHYGYPD